MSVARSKSYRRIVRWVLAWCALYTRGIPAAAAEGRRDELASDLFEQASWGDENALAPKRVAAVIAGRSIRGVVSDLLWRRGALRDAALEADTARVPALRRDMIALAVVLTVATVVVAWGGYVSIRTARAAALGEIAWFSETFLALCAFTLLAACGVVLLSRRRTRAIGALWMVLPSAALLHLGLFQLFSISATVGVLLNTMSMWGAANGLAIAGLVAVFLAAAVWWWPSRSRAARGEHVR